MAGYSTATVEAAHKELLPGWDDVEKCAAGRVRRSMSDSGTGPSSYAEQVDWATDLELKNDRRFQARSAEHWVRQHRLGLSVAISVPYLAPVIRNTLKSKRGDDDADTHRDRVRHLRYSPTIANAYVACYIGLRS